MPESSVQVQRLLNDIERRQLIKSQSEISQLFAFSEKTDFLYQESVNFQHVIRYIQYQRNAIYILFETQES